MGGGGKDGTSRGWVDEWTGGRVDSNADLLLGEQHDPEAGSKLAAEEDKHGETGAALISLSSLLLPADVCIYLFTAVSICCSAGANVSASLA